MISFDEFVAACGAFSHDNEYSGGTEVHIMAPWESPWKWQDNNTRLPEGVSEEEVLTHLAETDTIAVTCTDKDMIHDVWEMQSMGGNRNVWMIAAAGGVVQPTGPRLEAMRTIATWLFEQANAGRMERLGCLTLMNHNEICGAVKQWNDNASLVDVVARTVGKTADLRNYEENTLTMAMIRHGATVWDQFKQLPGVMMNYGLYDMQRDGQGKKSRILPLTMEGPTLTVEELKNDDLIRKILS